MDRGSREDFLVTHSFGHKSVCLCCAAILFGCSSACRGGSSQSSESTATTSQALGSTTEPAALIWIADIGVTGDFAAGGDTVFRSDDAQDCIGRVTAATSDTPAGTMTVDSLSLGTPLVMQPDPTYSFYFGQGGVFPVGGRVDVTVRTTGSTTDPPMEATRLHSAKDTFVNVTAPVIPSSGPNAGVIVVDSKRAFEVTWQPPTASGADEPEDNKLVVSLWDLAGATTVGEVRCGFDLASGHGMMPASLLHAVKAAVNPVGPIQYGALRVLVGDRKEYRRDGVSYVIELGPVSVQTTNIPVDNLATLE